MKRPPVRWDLVQSDIRDCGLSYRKQAERLNVEPPTYAGWRKGNKPTDWAAMCGMLALHSEFCGPEATRLRCPYVTII